MKKKYEEPKLMLLVRPDNSGISIYANSHEHAKNLAKLYMIEVLNYSPEAAQEFVNKSTMKKIYFH